MKHILLFALSLFVVVPCLAQEVQDVENFPQGEYFIYEGKIYVPTSLMACDYNMTSFELATYAEAQAFIEAWNSWLVYYNSLGLPSPYIPGSPDSRFGVNYKTWYPNPLSSLVIIPRRSGASDVVRWTVVFSFCPRTSNSHLSSSLFKGAVAGLNTQWCAGGVSFITYLLQNGITFILTPSNDGAKLIYYADAIYSDVEEPDPEPTEPDCVYTVVDGQILYVLPESFYPSSRYAEVVKGPSLYASTLEDAQRCRDNFASFLASYDWPFWGAPAVLPFSSPRIYECHQRWGGVNVSTFYRVVFGDYIASPDSMQYDSHYGQCLNDYSQGAGGTGGYNVCSLVKPSATLTDNVNSSSAINNSTLATGSGSATQPLTFSAGDVNFTQQTVAKVAASGDEDYTGTSIVMSEAALSEDGTTINITNNTEVTTNLELGDAPAADSYSDETVLEEKDITELEKQVEPTYTYIDASSTEKVLDREKLWQDVSDKFNDIFPVEKVLTLFTSLKGSAVVIPPLVLSFPNPFLDCTHVLTFDFMSYAQTPIIQLVRLMLGFFVSYETLICCVKLFA